MPETLITPFAKWILACAVLLGVVAPGVDAWAQMNPNAPPPGQAAPANPMCPRLEAQLASIDRGGSSGDPAKDDQIRRYQDAATKQQSELDRVTSQAKRQGCDSSGFFSLFSRPIGAMRPGQQPNSADAGQSRSDHQQPRAVAHAAGGADRDNQRRSVLTALAQNNCGPQYAAAAARPGQFF